MQYNTSCKLFYPCGPNATEVYMMIPRENRVRQKKQAIQIVPGIAVRRGKWVEQEIGIVDSGLVILRANTMLFHEIIQISPVFSG